MMDNCDKSVTSLAITEKRSIRPGGCIGIFFQLFDWNRRFAKKKLFSRKLLPPARPKHAPKKFAGDEKFPKPRLLAGGNGDDFPNLRKNGSHNIDSQSRPMQSPSLVARLMGLESIPAAEKEKLPNELPADIDKEKLSLEKISSKNELRPQKIQKTEVYEREPVGRLGFDSMPLKNMLSRSRRNHPKLASPVKSPRMAPGRNNSRMIDVAAKILEPGLQSRNRAKGALTYTSSRIHNLPPSMEGNACSPRSTSIDDLMMEGRSQVLNVREVPDHDGVAAKPMKVHSCKNCGDKFDDFASCSSLLKQPSVYASPISQYVEPSSVILEKEKKPVEQRNRQEMGNVFVQTQNEADQSFWRPFSSQPSSRQSDIQSSTSLKQKTIRPNKIPMGRDKVHQSSKLSNLQSSRVYDANVDNKSPNSRSRSRMPVKLDSDALDTGRKAYTKPDDSTSPVRKRRSVNSTTVKQRTALSKETSQGSFSSTSQNTTRRRLGNSAESSRTNSNKEKDIVSYSYNSHLKNKPGAHKDREYKRTYLNGSVDGNPSSSTIGESSSREEDSCHLSGDALGVLLEQKLKELTNQMDDELEAGGTPKRTTAMILQELITALNADRPTQNVLVDGSDQKKVSPGARVLATKFPFQVEERAKGASAGYSHNLDHYSPGSVLDASFSNDSYLSSSLDDGSVPGHDHLPPLEPEVDLVDSGYSFLSKGSNRLDRISDILSHISEALCCINISDSGLTERKSDNAKEVILNAEMVFQNYDGSKEFSLAGYLIEELEILASAMPAMEDIKDVYQLKGFLFDCIVEYLDLRYGPCWKSGFRAWTRTFPTRITGDILTRGVVEEVKRWTQFAGWNADEIIEWEMSHCLGKWTDFEIEGFEIGVEIEEELLDNLVNELVADFIMG